MGDPVAFVRQNTLLKPPSLVPELTLHLADKAVPLWELTEAELAEKDLPPPYWAFAWAGGQALARYIIDHPEVAAGKRVLDFASGSGIVAVAALWVSASHVVANDIDPFAAAAIALNAEANGVAGGLETVRRDMLEEPALAADGRPLFDLVLAGDVCYELPMSTRTIGWLRRHAAAGATVLMGDPGRSYLPDSGLTKLAEYMVPTPRELEDSDLRRTIVWRVDPA
ncbi:class I SAM-dependent methyltransferase [Thalassobaculum sp.]|uniref:class I SAM-dependent methyltransferase n=1 Tax=Thalassobaculum sp. TaxID=2022740 RepID=UPI003B5BDB7F